MTLYVYVAMLYVMTVVEYLLVLLQCLSVCSPCLCECVSGQQTRLSTLYAIWHCLTGKQGVYDVDVFLCSLCRRSIMYC